MSIDMAPGAQLLCSGGMSIDLPLAAQLSRAMSIDMAPGAQLLCSGGMSIDVPLAAQPRFFAAKNTCCGRRHDAC